MLLFQTSGTNVDPKDSFAWKDLTLEQKLAELKARNREAELRQGLNKDDSSFDKNIDKSIGNWSSLPKAPNQDVILLKKARGETIKFQALCRSPLRVHVSHATLLDVHRADQLGVGHY